MLFKLLFIVVITTSEIQYSYSQGNSTHRIEQTYVVFPISHNISYEIGNKKRFVPSDRDVLAGMKILEHYLNHQKGLMDLSKYKVQLFGYLNDDGEKVIWANYFCNAKGENWQKFIVAVDGLGNCYFNVKLNIETKEVFDLRINGKS